MARITAIGNQKGGVGKTTVTLGLATGLALLRRNVLIVDLDPQGDTTDALAAQGDFNIFDVLYAGEGGTLGQAAVATSWDRVDVVPGSTDLARIETESLVGAEQRLKAAIDGSVELQKYDHILIDLPPALGRLTLNGLIAADAVMVVTEPAHFSVKAVKEFLQTVGRVQSASYLNQELAVQGIIVNRFDTQRKTADQAFQVEQLRAAFGDAVLDPIIPLRTAISDSQSTGAPVTKFNTRGAALITELFVEHARKLEGGKTWRNPNGGA